MSSVIIRVGVALDRDVIQVLAPVHAAIKKARAQIAAEMKGVADAGKHAAKETADASKRSAKQQVQDAAYLAKMHIAYRRQMVKATEDSVNAEDKALKAAISDMNRSYKAYTRERSRLARDEASEERRRWREMASERRRVEDEALADVRRRIRERRTAEREHSRAERAREQRMSTIGTRAAWLGAAGLGAAYMAGSRAIGAGRSLIEGAGANLSFGSLAQQEVAFESRATDIANQAYFSGHSGAGSIRRDPGAIMNLAREVGNATAFNPDEVLEGLQKFVDKTGDLQLGREVLSDMARLAKAVGANLADVVDASADVANNLGDMEDKGPIIGEVMRQVAGMAKVGAVELKDLASQMAKIAAQAGVFEGPRAQTIRTLTMFAESARGEGGAASPAQAATAVQAFVAQLSKEKRLAAFSKLGIDVYNGASQVRDPRDIIVELLQKTKGDPRKMQPAIYEQQAKRVTNAFGSIFRDTYTQARGSEDERVKAGTDAVRAEFKRLETAAMSLEDVTNALSIRMRTTEDRMTLFNNAMRVTVRDIMPDVLESFRALQPLIFGTMRAFGGLSAWLNEHFHNFEDPETVSAGAAEEIAAANKLTERLRYGETGATPSKRFNGAPDSPVTTGELDIIDEKRAELQASLDKRKKALAKLSQERPERVSGPGQGKFDGYLTEADQKRARSIEALEMIVQQNERSLNQLDQQRSFFDYLRSNGIINVEVKNWPKTARSPATTEPNGRPNAQVENHVTDSHPE